MTRTWSLEFSDDQGITGAMQLTVEGTATFAARVSLPGEGVVVVNDDDVSAPRGAQLVVRAEGLWAELLCETPGEHWSFGLEAFGLRFDTAEEAATSDFGDRVAVGYDLEWEIPDRVYGDLLVGRETIPIDARGTFTTPP